MADDYESIVTKIIIDVGDPSKTLNSIKEGVVNLANSISGAGGASKAMLVHAAQNAVAQITAQMEAAKKSFESAVESLNRLKSAGSSPFGGPASEAAIKKATDDINRYGKQLDDLQKKLQQAKRLEGSFMSQGNPQDNAIQYTIAQVSAIETWGRLNHRIQVVNNTILQTAQAFEVYRAKLSTVMTDSQQVDAALEKSVKFAAQTPFSVEQVVNARTQLAIYNQDVEKTIGIAGDIAAQMGQPIEHVASAIGKSFEGSALGVRVLTNSLGISRSQLRMYGAVVNEQGGVLLRTREQIDAFRRAIEAIHAERFAGGMEIRMATLGGAMQNLEDAKENMYRSLGEQITPYVIPMVQMMTKAIETLSSVMKAPFIGGFTSSILGMVGVVGSAGTAFALAGAQARLMLFNMAQTSTAVVAVEGSMIKLAEAMTMADPTKRIGTWGALGAILSNSLLPPIVSVGNAFIGLAGKIGTALGTFTAGISRIGPTLSGMVGSVTTFLTGMNPLVAGFVALGVAVAAVGGTMLLVKTISENFRYKNAEEIRLKKSEYNEKMTLSRVGRILGDNPDLSSMRPDQFGPDSETGLSQKDMSQFIAAKRRERLAAAQKRYDVAARIQNEMDKKADAFDEGLPEELQVKRDIYVSPDAANNMEKVYTGKDNSAIILDYFEKTAKMQGKADAEAKMYAEKRLAFERERINLSRQYWKENEEGARIAGLAEAKRLRDIQFIERMRIGLTNQTLYSRVYASSRIQDFGKLQADLLSPIQKEYRPADPNEGDGKAYKSYAVTWDAEQKKYIEPQLDSAAHVNELSQDMVKKLGERLSLINELDERGNITAEQRVELLQDQYRYQSLLALTVRSDSDMKIQEEFDQQHEKTLKSIYDAQAKILEQQKEQIVYLASIGKLNKENANLEILQASVRARAPVYTTSQEFMRRGRDDIQKKIDAASQNKNDEYGQYISLASELKNLGAAPYLLLFAGPAAGNPATGKLLAERYVNLEKIKQKYNKTVDPENMDKLLNILNDGSIEDFDKQVQATQTDLAQKKQRDLDSLRSRLLQQMANDAKKPENQEMVLKTPEQLRKQEEDINKKLQESFDLMKSGFGSVMPGKDAPQYFGFNAYLKDVNRSSIQQQVKEAQDSFQNAVLLFAGDTQRIEKERANLYTKLYQMDKSYQERRMAILNDMVAQDTRHAQGSSQIAIAALEQKLYYLGMEKNKTKEVLEQIYQARREIGEREYEYEKTKFDRIQELQKQASQFKSDAMNANPYKTADDIIADYDRQLKESQTQADERFNKYVPEMYRTAAESDMRMQETMLTQDSEASDANIRTSQSASAAAQNAILANESSVAQYDKQIEQARKNLQAVQDKIKTAREENQRIAAMDSGGIPNAGVIAQRKLSEGNLQSLYSEAEVARKTLEGYKDMQKNAKRSIDGAYAEMTRAGAQYEAGVKQRDSVVLRRQGLKESQRILQEGGSEAYLRSEYNRAAKAQMDFAATFLKGKDGNDPAVMNALSNHPVMKMWKARQEAIGKQLTVDRERYNLEVDKAGQQEQDRLKNQREKFIEITLKNEEIKMEKELLRIRREIADVDMTRNIERYNRTLYQQLNTTRTYLKDLYEPRGNDQQEQGRIIQDSRTRLSMALQLIDDEYAKKMERVRAGSKAEQVLMAEKAQKIKDAQQNELNGIYAIIDAEKQKRIEAIKEIQAIRDKYDGSRLGGANSPMYTAEEGDAIEAARRKAMGFTPFKLKRFGDEELPEDQAKKQNATDLLESYARSLTSNVQTIQRSLSDVKNGFVGAIERLSQTIKSTFGAGGAAPAAAAASAAAASVATGDNRNQNTPIGKTVPGAPGAKNSAAASSPYPEIVLPKELIKRLETEREGNMTYQRTQERLRRARSGNSPAELPSAPSVSTKSLLPKVEQPKLPPSPQTNAEPLRAASIKSAQKETANMAGTTVFNTYNVDNKEVDASPLLNVGFDHIRRGIEFGGIRGYT